MSTLTVRLNDTTTSFLSDEVRKGNYASPSEAVEELLNRFAEWEREPRQKSAALEQALQDGIDSGLAEGDMDDAFRRVAQRTGLSAEAIFAK